MGSEVMADMTGSQRATCQSDINTGILTNGKPDATMKGTIQVLGRDLPVTIKISRRITTKKL